MGKTVISLFRVPKVLIIFARMTQFLLVIFGTCELQIVFIYTKRPGVVTEWVRYVLCLPWQGRNVRRTWANFSRFWHIWPDPWKEDNKIMLFQLVYLIFSIFPLSPPLHRSLGCRKVSCARWESSSRSCCFWCRLAEGTLSSWMGTRKETNQTRIIQNGNFVVCWTKPKWRLKYLSQS